MENESSLEKKVDRIDWKQWLPVYGVYKAYKDARESKPSFLSTPNTLLWSASTFYHGAVSIVPLIYATLYGADQIQKLF